MCGDGWTNEDAQVVCRQLGFDDSAATAFQGGHFAAGSGSIHYDDVACTGSEDSLASCTGLQGSHNCAHSEDAGVDCSVTAAPTEAPTEAPPPPPTEAPTTPAIQVRLADGASAWQLKAELRYFMLAHGALCVTTVGPTIKKKH